MAAIKKGDIVTVFIEALALGGKGVAKIDDYVIFVERTLPKQTVKALIYKKKKNYAEAKVVEIIENSEDTIEAPCPHFGVCGGCLLQNLDYEKQVEYKQNQIIESLHHIGGFTNVNVQNILPSPDIFFYRNKMEFSFSVSRWLTTDEINAESVLYEKDFALGLHVPGRFDKVLNIENCLLLSEYSNGIFSFIKNWTKKSGLRPYSTKDHKGFWRFLVIREGKNTRQLMLNLVTADQPQHFDTLAQLSEELVDTFPAITTIVHNINKKKAQIAVGDEERVLYGAGYIYEKLNKYSFQISANSFFQTNTRQTENLFKQVLQLGNFSPHDIVYDLYSGTGSIAIYIAEHVQRVVGIELVPQAIENARQNCNLNHIENCIFLQGDLKAHVSEPERLISQFGKPDVIIVDPPRSGMHPDIPAKLIELFPDRIIYVSCNPATFARDVKMLCNSHYVIDVIQPVDMFPHTAHCEIVALLQRNI